MSTMFELFCEHTQAACVYEHTLTKTQASQKLKLTSYAGGRHNMPPPPAS